MCRFLKIIGTIVVVLLILAGAGYWWARSIAKTQVEESWTALNDCLTNSAMETDRALEQCVADYDAGIWLAKMHPVTKSTAELDLVRANQLALSKRVRLAFAMLDRKEFEVLAGSLIALDESAAIGRTFEEIGHYGSWRGLIDLRDDARSLYGVREVMAALSMEAPDLLSDFVATHPVTDGRGEDWDLRRGAALCLSGKKDLGAKLLAVANKNSEADRWGRPWLALVACGVISKPKVEDPAVTAPWRAQAWLLQSPPPNPDSDLGSLLEEFETTSPTAQQRLPFVAQKIVAAGPLPANMESVDRVLALIVGSGPRQKKNEFVLLAPNLSACATPVSVFHPAEPTFGNVAYQGPAEPLLAAATAIEALVPVLLAPKVIVPEQPKKKGRKPVELVPEPPTPTVPAGLGSPQEVLENAAINLRVEAALILARFGKTADASAALAPIQRWPENLVTCQVTLSLLLELPLESSPLDTWLAEQRGSTSAPAEGAEGKAPTAAPQSWEQTKRSAELKTLLVLQRMDQDRHEEAYTLAVELFNDLRLATEANGQASQSWLASAFEAAAWLRAATALRAGHQATSDLLPQAPAQLGSDSVPMELISWFVGAIALSPSDRLEKRMQFDDFSRSVTAIQVMPAVYYVTGSLAEKEVEFWLDALFFNRLVLDAGVARYSRQHAAHWRGDTKAVELWVQRSQRINSKLLTATDATLAVIAGLI